MAYTPLQLAESFVRTGELADALDALNDHLAVHAGDDNARRLRAQVCQRISGQDNLQRALDDLQKLTNFTYEDWLQVSIIHERMGAIEASIDDMKALLALPLEAHASTADDDVNERTRQHDRAVERLVILYAQTNQIDEALAVVRQQNRQWRWLQWEADLLVMAGDDVMASARYGLVLAQLQTQIDAQPNRHLDAIKGRILLARGHTYRRQRQIGIARQHYEEAQLLLAGDPLIAFNLGCLYALEGDLQQAIELCEPVWVAFPSGVLHEQMASTLADDEAYTALRAYLAQ